MTYSNLYWVSVSYYNPDKDKTETEQGVMIGESMTEITEYITEHYCDDVESISVEMLVFDNGPFVRISEDHAYYYKKVIKDSNDWA